MNKLKLTGLTLAMAAALALGTTSFEGNKSIPYRDIGGVWTACAGDTHDVDPTHKYSPEECQQRLVKQLEAHNDGLLNCLPELGEAPDHVHAAMLDLGYNVGVNAVCKSSISRKVKAKDYPSACETISEFRFAAHKDCADRANGCYGIYKRRQWERAMCDGSLSRDQIAKGYAGFLEAQ